MFLTPRKVRCPMSSVEVKCHKCIGDSKPFCSVGGFRFGQVLVSIRVEHEQGVSDQGFLCVRW